MRMPRKMIEQLREVRNKLGGGPNAPKGCGDDAMTGHFDTIGPDAGQGLPKSERDVNAFINERTRIWRRSWILPQLDEILKWADGEPKGG